MTMNIVENIDLKFTQTIKHLTLERLQSENMKVLSKHQVKNAETSEKISD